MKRFLASILCLLVLVGAARADGSLMQSETVGKLRIGMSAHDVAAAIGNPSKRSSPSQADDGKWTQAWEYKRLGLTLLVASPKRGGPESLATMTLDGACKLSTSRGIHLGSTDRDVQKAYEAEIDKDASTSDMIVAGSLKGGLIFTIERGKVVRIFIGAAAH